MSTPYMRLVDTTTGNALEIQVDADTLASTLTFLLQNKSGTLALTSDLDTLNSNVGEQLTTAINDAKQTLINQFNQSISDLIGMAPPELDTLKEIADKFVTEDSAIGSILTALADKVASTTFNNLVNTVSGKLNATHEGSGGNSHALASTTVAGFMSSSDKTKLNGIAANANNYTLPAASATVLGGVKVSVSGSTLTITTT